MSKLLFKKTGYISVIHNLCYSTTAQDMYLHMHVPHCKFLTDLIKMLISKLKVKNIRAFNVDGDTWT